MKKSYILLAALLSASVLANAQNSTLKIPVININIEGGKIVTDKENYLKAAITIDGAGIYEDMSDSVQIRGRGNSSWTTPQVYTYGDKQYIISNPKNPYKLKFAKKKTPFGLTKGKTWVLLANQINGSLMTNAIGMKVAQVVGTEAANDIIPVDLYINGDYRGNYNFTEQVGLSSNSITLEDESKATLLELDTYFDETYKFKDNYYGLPANIKFPEFGKDETSLTQQNIEDRFGQLAEAIQNGTNLSSQIDLDALARYMLVNELICNFEILHPKSTYLYNEDVTDTANKWKFGPVWDLDWAYGYDVNFTHARIAADYDFWNPEKSYENTKMWQVIRNKDEVKRAYFKVWKNFMEKGLQTVLDYCDSYYEWNKSSFKTDGDKWGSYDYASASVRYKNWLNDRANSIYASLDKYDDLPVTGITAVRKNETDNLVNVIDLCGRIVKKSVSRDSWRQGLHAGVYIVGGKRMIIGNIAK